MESPDFLDAQVAVVQAVVADAPRAPWRRLLADVEIGEAADSYHLDSVALAIVARSDGTLEDPSFSLGPATREAVVTLYKERKTATAEPFSGFELQVEQDGSYRFTFSHEPPKRLNGIWDEAKEQRLDNYLDHYRRELAGGR